MGHDDRVCSYAALRVILDMDEIPEKPQYAFWQIKRK